MYGAASAPTKTDTGETEYTQSRDDEGARELRGVDVERAKNGGFVARCNYKQAGDGPYVEPETHAFSSFDELAAFLRDKFGAAPAAAQPGDDVETDQ